MMIVKDIVSLIGLQPVKLVIIPVVNVLILFYKIQTPALAVFSLWLFGL